MYVAQVQLMQKNIETSVPSYQIESNWIEWNTSALLCRSCKHQLYRPIALKSQFCVCTHDARFICLRAYHGHIPVLSEDQTKAKAKAKNKEIANNNQTRHAVQCTTLTVYMLGKCGEERTKERERERAMLCKFIVFNLPFLRESFCYAYALGPSLPRTAIQILEF